MSKLTKTEEYKHKFETSFEAAVALSQNSRKLSESCENVVIGSDAIVWELTGVEPKLLRSKIQKKLNRISNTIKNHSDYINDSKVLDLVQKSIKESLKVKHLIYQCQDEDKFTQSRVKIICNMIWEDLLRS